MAFQPNFNKIVEDAFSRHGVDNPQLQNAIVEIINRSIDYNYIAEKITEVKDREKRTRDIFK